MTMTLPRVFERYVAIGDSSTEGIDDRDGRGGYRGWAPRLGAVNDGVRRACSRPGAILVDFARYPVATDDRLWSADRIHANASGHERITQALAHAVALPGSDDAWQQPLPARERRPRGA